MIIVIVIMHVILATITIGAISIGVVLTIGYAPTPGGCAQILNIPNLISRMSI